MMFHVTKHRQLLPIDHSHAVVQKCWKSLFNTVLHTSTFGWMSLLPTVVPFPQFPWKKLMLALASVTFANRSNRLVFLPILFFDSGCHVPFLSAFCGSVSNRCHSTWCACEIPALCRWRSKLSLCICSLLSSRGGACYAIWC